MKHTLKRQTDFQKIYQERNIKDSKYYRVYSSCTYTESKKTAVVASKKLGNAVKRNYLKRQVRSILNTVSIPSTHIIIIKPPALRTEFAKLKKSLTELLTL